MASRPAADKRLTVAVTGPTGEIGKAVVAALERSREIGQILGMARRPFDPHARGWKKVSYRRGDVLDRDAVEALVAEADVVVHLAFMIMGAADASNAVNLVGSRNVFEATVSAGAKRLVYASSVAAYGFHSDNPQPLTEEVPARGTDAHYYSAQKAAVEALLAEALAGSSTNAYVLRPCIVAGAQAPLLIDSLPYTQISGAPAGSSAQPARRLADPQASPARPGHPLPAGAPRRCRQRDARGRSRPRRAGRVQPRGPRTADGQAVGGRARLVFDPGARAGGGRCGGDDRAPWLPAGTGPMDRRLTRAGDHEREQGPAGAGLAPRHDALQTLRETITASRMEPLIR